MKLKTQSYLFAYNEDCAVNVERAYVNSKHSLAGAQRLQFKAP